MSWKKALAVCTALATTPAVAQRPQKPAAQEVKEETAEAVDASKRYLNEQKEDFTSRVEQQLAALRGELAELRQKVKKEGKHLQRETRARVDALERKEQVAEERLEQLRRSGEDAWRSLRDGVVNAVNAFETGLAPERNAKGGKR